MRTITDDMNKVLEQLKELTAAIQEQNEILKSCIAQPEGQPARFVVEDTRGEGTF